MKSALECKSRTNFDNQTLTLHNVTLTSQKPYQHNITSAIAAKQRVINEVYVVSKNMFLKRLSFGSKAETRVCKISGPD